MLDHLYIIALLIIGALCVVSGLRNIGGMPPGPKRRIHLLFVVHAFLSALPIASLSERPIEGDRRPTPHER
jgi:hypothetical protein